MKRLTLSISAVIALVALIAAPLLNAAPHGRRGKGFHGGPEAGGIGAIFHLREQLDLSDQQVDQIKAIFRDLREQNESYREQLRGGTEGVLDTLLQNPNNTAAAQTLIDSQAAARKAMQMNVLAATSKALNVLTADQRAKLGERIAERKARRSERR